jgi:hypothetical protein
LANRKTSIIAIPESILNADLIPLINERLRRIDQEIGALTPTSSPSTPGGGGGVATASMSDLAWAGATVSVYGIPLFFHAEFELITNTEFSSPVTPQRGWLLLVYVFAHATDFYTFSFDPLMFVDTASSHSPDPGKVAVFMFAGRGDGKWWPTNAPRTGMDPLS